MPTCATQQKLAETAPIYNLILPVPATDFRDFLDEVDKLPRFAPKIIEEIEKDLDANARAKKKLRLEDRKFFENRTLGLPDVHVEEAELLADQLEIGTGRPRMSAELVYLFVMIRGFLGGSLASKTSRRFLRESMSLYAYLDNRDLKMPGVTTILENVNLVSAKTLKKRYRGLLRKGRKTANALTMELNRFDQGLLMGMPRQRGATRSWR